MTSVEALAEVCHRYQAVIGGLLDVVMEVQPTLPDEERARAHDAVLDTKAQLDAISDHLDAALKDLGITGA